MSVIGAIRDFIATCPYLDEFKETFSKVDIDFLEEKPTNYMVEAVPAEPIVKQYINGDSIRRVAFHFCSGEIWKILIPRNFMNTSRNGWKIVHETEFFPNLTAQKKLVPFGQQQTVIW